MIPETDMQYLISHCDLSDNEKMEITKLPKTTQIKILLNRSTIPYYRNLYAPPGELYAPIECNTDYMIKLLEKPAWGGYLLFLTVWDMVILDFDQMDYSVIREKVRFYENELFYVRKTQRGYHLYLISRPANHMSKYAIYMRIRLGCDPAHGSNSLYTGSSVRLSHKYHVNDDLVSKFIGTLGTGTPDPEMLKLYNIIDGLIVKYSKYGPSNISSIFPELHQMNKNMINTETMAGVQIEQTAGLVFTNNNLQKIAPANDAVYNLVSPFWTQFIRTRVLHHDRLVYLLMAMHRNMCYSNLYRIIKDHKDYAYVIHLQQNCHSLVYRDLFMIDYDNSARLSILARYVRKNQDATFRVVKTNKGFHAFLTSYPIHYRKSLKLSELLRSDPCHILGTLYRGYSVRINQKRISEKPYLEYHKYGSAQEDPRLVTLYNMHIDLHRQNCENKVAIMNTQRIAAKAMLQRD